MSPNPYPVFSVSQSDKPEQIKAKISMLIQLYLKNPNLFIADAVVKHITAILAHPGYINDIDQRCRLRQLEMHWRGLAWIETTSIATKTNDYQTDAKAPSIPMEIVIFE